MKKLFLFLSMSLITGILFGRSTFENNVVFIAANDATAEEKSIADSQCDGTADQTEINAALTAGYSIRLSSGTFNVTAPITAAVNNVIIEGISKEKTTIFLSNGSNLQVMIIGGNYWTIKNLLIDGNKASNAGVYCNGIYAADRTDITLDNCEIKNAEQNGISMKNACYNWLIENSYIHDNINGCNIFGYQENPGIIGPSKINIINTHCHNSQEESLIKTQSDPSYTYVGHDWNVDRCEFTGMTGYKGLMISGTKNFNITNCYFDIDSLYGSATGNVTHVRYYHNATGTISNNKFVTDHGIEIWGSSGGINIIGNHFTETRQQSQQSIMIITQGADGYNTSNINVTGNVFYNSSAIEGKSVIVLYSAPGQMVSDVNIVGNTFKDDRGASALCRYGIVTAGTGTIKNVNISDNKMEGILETGIVIAATTTANIKISNNIFTDIPIGINATDWSNLIINGNRFTDCPYPLSK